LAHLDIIDHPRYQGMSTYCKLGNRMHWGRGGQIETEVINQLLDVHDAVLRKHRWVNGDILVLDNHRLWHGRELLLEAETEERLIYSRFGYWS